MIAFIVLFHSVEKREMLSHQENISSNQLRESTVERPVPESEPGVPVPNQVPEPGNEIGRNREI